MTSQNDSPTIEPKKSARLAQKRKLREEAGTPVSEDDFYFPPVTSLKGQGFSPIKSGGLQSPSPSSTTPSTSKDKLTCLESSGSTKLQPPVKNVNLAVAVSPAILVKPTPKSFLPRQSNPSTSTFKNSNSIQISSTSNINLTTTAISAVTNSINNIMVTGISTNTIMTTISSVLKSSPSLDITSVGQKAASALKISSLGIYSGSSSESCNISNKSEAFSDEEKWLSALESGKLEEFEDKLHMMKNSKLMTTRQRALLEKKDKDQTLGLPVNTMDTEHKQMDEMSGSDGNDKEEKFAALSAVLLQQQAERTERTTQMLGRIDNDKKRVDTSMRRSSSNIKQTSKTKVKLAPIKSKVKSFNDDPKIIILQRVEGTTITFPLGMNIPIKKTVSPVKIPSIIKCAVEGCPNQKKYSCSKTKVPLCSLSCYKTNLERYNTQLVNLEFSDEYIGITT